MSRLPTAPNHPELDRPLRAKTELGGTTHMKNRLISGACWLIAILFTGLASVVTAYYGVFQCFAVAAIIWAAFDCRRVKLRRYRTGIGGGPITIFVLFLLLGWPIIFPWYLGMRLKIFMGTARLREEYQPWRMSDATIGPTGLVQPWHGRKL